MSQTQVERLFIKDRTVVGAKVFRMTATNQTSVVISLLIGSPMIALLLERLARQQ